MESHKSALERIGKLRRKLGLTQKGLAKLAGVSQSLIAKIESGRVDPAYSKVLQIHEALDREMDRKDSRKKAVDIMSAKIVSVTPKDRLDKVVGLMKAHELSQLPVFEGPQCVGSLSDAMLMEWLAKYGLKISQILVSEAMADCFPSVPHSSNLDAVAGLLRYYKAVLVKREGKIVGIITKADLIKALQQQ